jgi:hypothetical protein
MESILKLRRLYAPSLIKVRRVGVLMRCPQFVICESLNDCSPVNLLRASEKPGRDKSGTKHKLSSFSFLTLAMSNMVSEKFLSATLTICRDLRFLRYLWNLTSKFSL